MASPGDPVSVYPRSRFVRRSDPVLLSPCTHRRHVNPDLTLHRRVNEERCQGGSGN
jgi:hypothetical protein